MWWLLHDVRHWRVFSAALLLCAGAWMWQARVPRSEAAGPRLPSPRADFPAPPFTLTTLTHTTATLPADYRGQVVIVNFWATWCGPCRAEMPALQRLADAHSAAGLQVLGLNATAQDSLPAVQTFVQDYALTFPILLDSDNAVVQRYLVRAFPTTFIIDRRGLIRAVLVGGPLTEATTYSLIAPLLAESP